MAAMVSAHTYMRHVGCENTSTRDAHDKTVLAIGGDYLEHTHPSDGMSSENPYTYANVLTSALDCASAKGHAELIRVLVEEYGANAGKKSIRYAAAGGHIAALRVLIANRSPPFSWQDVVTATDAPPVRRDSDQRPLLHHSAMHGHEEVVTLLCEAARSLADPRVFSAARDTDGFGVDSVDGRGDSALFLATLRGHNGVMRALIGLYGADPKQKSTKGSSLLHVAAANNDPTAIHILLASSGEGTGADASVADDDGIIFPIKILRGCIASFLTETYL